jgi:hypothetical protein
LSLIERQTYGSTLAERDFRITEGEKNRGLGKADKQVDKMLLALPSRPEMRSAANRHLSVLSRIRHIQVLFPI